MLEELIKAVLDLKGRVEALEDLAAEYESERQQDLQDAAEEVDKIRFSCPVNMTAPDSPQFLEFENFEEWSKARAVLLAYNAGEIA